MPITSEYTFSGYVSEMPKILSKENKRVYKKALAKMMVFWIITTRNSWRDKLVNGDFNYWKTNLPYLAGAFQNGGMFEQAEWDNFFSQARAAIRITSVSIALNDINHLAMDFWVPMGFDPECPADEAIDLMFKAFADRVDAIPEK